MTKLIEEIQKLIAINTEYDETTAQAGQPMGAGCAQGLAYMQKVAEADGFAVETYDGYALAICYGDQPQRVEAVSHIDVVPATGEWSIPPYEGRLVGNRLYGRGTQDMKTALWLTYRALRKIKAEQPSLKRQIRVVVGVDEERSMEDIAYYLEKAGLPDFAFTPDSTFPLCLGEKGAVSWSFSRSVSTSIQWLRAGSASNVVCGEVEVGLAHDLLEKVIEALDRAKYDYEHLEGGVRILGKSAHTSKPHLGVNALVRFLEVYQPLVQETWIDQLYQTFYKYTGEGIAIDDASGPMGPASVCMNVLNVQDGHCQGEIDIRFPTPYRLEEVKERVKTNLQGFTMEVTYGVPAIITDREDPFVQACLSTYRDHFPEIEGEPFYSGGVTYSKVYQNRCIAFGSRLPNAPYPSLAHQVDEYIEIDHLESLVDLYADALVRCANL